MNKPTLLDTLSALPADGVKRTKSGRVRELLPEIEAAQMAGYANEDIAKALALQGLEISKKVLETTLYRIRKGRGLHNPKSTGLHNPQTTPENTTQDALKNTTIATSTDDVSINAGNDETGLSAKAKRERRAEAFIKDTPRNSLLGKLTKESNT